jgi:hypothetical protein
MSQVSFFMLENDEREFVEMLSARVDTFMFSGRFFPVKRPTPTRYLPPFGAEGLVTLVNSGLRPSPECDGRGEGDSARLYMFDRLKYPQCELSRSRFEDGILLGGRIYAKIGWLDSQNENRIYRNWYVDREKVSAPSWLVVGTRCRSMVVSRRTNLFRSKPARLSC